MRSKWPKSTQTTSKQLIKFFFNFIYLFIFIYGCVGSLLLCEGFSLVVASRGHSSLRCTGLSLLWPVLLRSTGSRRAGSVIVAHGLVAPRHVGSSQTRARTRVPCIGRQILNQCATREALKFYEILIKYKSCDS